MKEYLKRIDLKINLIIISIWLSLALFLAFIRYMGVELEMPYYFPISIFSFSFNIDGLLFFFQFILLLYNSVNKSDKLNFTQIYLFSFFLILLGNLIQGNSFSGLTEPFLHSHIEYYNDALKITDWRSWLSSFNANQSILLEHSRTHPPFAVLINFLLIKISNNNIYILSLLFTIIFSTSLFFLKSILKDIGLEKSKQNQLVLLFAIIPSINIYGLTCLDSIVLTTVLLAIFSLIKIMKNNKIDLFYISLLITGILLSNLLNFGSVFLFATLILYSLLIIKTKNNDNYNVAHLIIISTSIIAVLICLFLLYTLFNYNHLEAFQVASKLENPNGFRAFIEPLNYFFTRIEGVSEILLFLGIPTLSIVIKNWKFKTDSLHLLIYSAFSILLLMLVTGAYRTGETARAAMFIYPFFILLLSKENSENLRAVIFLTGIQTAIMQLFGFYIW